MPKKQIVNVMQPGENKLYADLTVRYFLKSVGWILLITGVAMLISALGTARLLWFADPCSAPVSAISAIKELFGLLFLRRSVRSPDGYGYGLFPGQLNFFRWRELCFGTFDLGTLALFAISRGWGDGWPFVVFRKATPKNGQGC
jgi:hypothetical protein